MSIVRWSIITQGILSNINKSSHSELVWQSAAGKKSWLQFESTKICNMSPRWETPLTVPFLLYGRPLALCHTTCSDYNSSHYGKYPHCVELQLSRRCTNNVVSTEYMLIKLIFTLNCKPLDNGLFSLKVIFKQKCKTLDSSRFSNVRIYCASWSYIIVYWIFWGFGLWSYKK